MADRYHNPFQGIDVSVPEGFREDFARFCLTGREEARASLESSPFPRMVDMWFLAICWAVRHKLKPVDVSGMEMYKIIEGSILSSDPWRIQTLMLIAISETEDIGIVSEPRKMMHIATGLAVAGLPPLITTLKDSESSAIWNLSDAVDRLVTQRKSPSVAV